MTPARSIAFIGGLVVCMMAFAVPPRSVPAIRTPIPHVQPDGDTLTVLLRGDERHHWMMTEDGWLVRENGKGVICYMQTDKRETAVVSKRQAHNADKRRCSERRWLKRKGIKKG